MYTLRDIFELSLSKFRSLSLFSPNYFSRIFLEFMFYRKCYRFVTISCFGDKTGNLSFSPKIALFHIICYFIGKVSPVYGFLAGFSSPESIFADKKYVFPVLSPKQEICHFFQNRIISHQLLLHR